VKFFYIKYIGCWNIIIIFN